MNHRPQRLINSLPRKSESAPANSSADCRPFDNGLTNTDNASASGASTSADSLRNDVCSISSPSSQSDKATLRELLPAASDEVLNMHFWNLVVSIQQQMLFLKGIPFKKTAIPQNVNH